MRDHTRARAAGVVSALIAGALCVGCSADDPSVSLEMRIVQDTAAESLTEMAMIVWGGHETYYAHNQVLLTEEDVKAARVVRQNGAPAMELTLTGEGREKLRHVTRQNVGSRLGIIIDGRLQCASLIDAPIENGTVTVAGYMLERAAMRVSRALTQSTPEVMAADIFQ